MPFLFLVFSISGSGKTTLLNALTHRSASNLKMDGEIKINGIKATKETMSMISSFVQQVDLFFGQMTGLSIIILKIYIIFIELLIKTFF